MSSALTWQYRLAITYRFILAFVIGYLCWSWFNVLLAYGFHAAGMPRAESVFFASFLTIFFACIFVLYSFCVSSLKWLSVQIFAICAILYALCAWLQLV